MPIARFQLPDGRIARFEVPDGTTPEQAHTLMSQYISGNSQDNNKDSNGLLGSLPKWLGEGIAPIAQSLTPSTQTVNEIKDRGKLAVSDPLEFVKQGYKNTIDAGIGAVDAGINVASGLYNGVAAPISGVLAQASGLTDDWRKYGGNLSAENTYQPRTERGQEYADNINKVMSDVLLPLGMAAPAMPRGQNIVARLNHDSTVNKSPVRTKVDEILANRVQDTNTLGPGKEMPGAVNMELLRKVREEEAARSAQEQQQATQEAAQIAVQERQAALEAEVRRNVAMEANARNIAQLEEAQRAATDEATKAALDKEIEAQRAFLSTGENAVGDGKVINRTPTTDSGLMGLPERPVEPPIGLSTGENKPGGSIVNRPTVSDSGLMGLPEKPNAAPVGLSTGENKSSVPDPNRVVGDSNLMGTPTPPSPDFFGSAGAIPTMRGGRRGGVQGGSVDRGLHDILTFGIPKLVEHIRDNYGGSVSSFLDAQVSKLKLSSTPSDFISKLPGMRSDADKLVTKPTPAKDLVEKAAAEPDGRGLSLNLQSGLQSAGEKLNSTMVQNSAKWFNWSQNRSNYVIREAVLPLERMYASLGKKLEDLHYIIHSEMFENSRFTDAELGQMGLHGKTLDAYKATREVFETLFKEQNAARTTAGKSALTRQDAYMASVFRGDYHVPIYDKNGKLRFYFQTTTRGQAKNAINWIKENYADHPEIDVSGLKYRDETMYKPSGRFGDAPRDVMSSWKDIVEALGDDPLAAELDTAMKQWVAEKGSEAFRQDLHHTKVKTNVRGFEGDQPWLSSQESAHNWAKAQIDYLKKAAKWSSAQEAISNVKEYLSNPEILKNQENNVALTKAYLYNHMGLTKNYARSIENGLAGLAGISRSTVRNFGELARAGVYVKALTANIGYYLATPFTAIPHSLAMFSKELGEGNAKFNPLNFSLDMLTAALPDKVNMWSNADKARLDWAAHNGGIQNFLLEDGKSIGAHPVVDTAMSFVNRSIALPDYWIRRMTFLPFAKALEASGKFPTKEAAWTRAAEITDQVAVSMREQDRPLGVQKAGIVGTAAYTLHAPLFNVYNNLGAHINYFRDNPSAKTAAPLATYLGAMVAVSGVYGLPVVNEMSKLYDMIRLGLAHYLPESYPTYDPRVELLKSLPETKILGLTGGEAASYGGASALLGTDMRSRLSNETVDSEHIARSLVPGIGIYGDMASSALQFAKSPNAQTGTQLAKDFAPGSLARGTLETQMPQFKSPVQAHADQGITSWRNPNDLDNPAVYINRTPEEVDKRRMGLTHIDEAIRREKDARNRQEDYLQDTARKGIVDNLYKDIGNGRIDSDGFAIKLGKYISLNGTPETLMSQLETKLQDMNVSPQEKAMIHAKTQAQIMSIVRRKQMDTVN
jgi:hypothetical protein